ncbi:VF530 family protein [Catenovulum sp. 2E275]|uniref:VF530 family protein n=1 Tax=Catenovulum sp. 2E275 TaxID=2980497 RepID=UPI0021CF4E9D|nr:VF530 family protein [Catenovulum sp. 2E275]MCU4675285.1 VF530 family protein [Catenovulum sp. 2E275]
MTEQNEMLNNPLHGVKLEQLLTELVEHYGWEILAEYTRIKCFDKLPSIESSLKFLRKTEWAREKLEIFYLYKFKNLPKADDANYALPPRKRIIPAHQKPRQPQVLVLGQAPQPKDRGSNSRNQNTSKHPARRTPRNKTRQDNQSADKPYDPWAVHR